MCWDNKNWAFSPMEHPFTNATHKKLIHCTSPMRTYNNHIHIKFRGFLQNYFYRCALHKKRCCIQACLAQSICNRLNMEVLAMESFSKSVTDRLWVRIQSNLWVHI